MLARHGTLGQAGPLGEDRGASAQIRLQKYARGLSLFEKWPLALVAGQDLICDLWVMSQAALFNTERHNARLPGIAW